MLLLIPWRFTITTTKTTNQVMSQIEKVVDPYLLEWRWRRLLHRSEVIIDKASDADRLPGRVDRLKSSFRVHGNLDAGRGSEYCFFGSVKSSANGTTIVITMSETVEGYLAIAFLSLLVISAIRLSFYSHRIGFEIESLILAATYLGLVAREFWRVKRAQKLFEQFLF